uniref:Small ribosomal subunit protein uS14c n=1 Tax=Euglena hiemalis TaxID=392896 RepID=A0A345UC60_9EUGL|nr:ribosomal protein S14 [Euglena hiemalis]AXI98046.1 ribosomal protein S14 [Euglena hiemalis]
MAKKSIIQRENKRETLVNKYKNLRSFYKGKIKEESDFGKKLKFSSCLQKLPRNSAPSRLRNRCYVTGRGRGYFRIFGLSRHIFRDMSHYGLLPGVTKASW